MHSENLSERRRDDESPSAADSFYEVRAEQSDAALHDIALPSSAAKMPNGRALLAEAIADCPTRDLGAPVPQLNVHSTVPTPQTLPAYQVEYPAVVTAALAQLVEEYNLAFQPLVDKNREHETDYRFNRSPAGTPLNHFVQIDMVGLPESFLEAAAPLSVEEVREVLRKHIFEIENSIAAYHLLSTVGAPHAAGDTLFSCGFRAGLESIRQSTGRPIALLAVTQEKYDSMLGFEFGQAPGQPLSEADVKRLSGFDAFFGPSEFKQYLARNEGRCDYLLYVRSSDPVQTMIDPNSQRPQTLLDDPILRAVIKQFALTFNIDAPHMSPDQRINDTKEYLPAIGMGYRFAALNELLSNEMIAHLQAKKPWAAFSAGPRLSDDFAAYLREQGIDPHTVESGAQHLRIKPIKGTYGCYGHARGNLADKDFRGEIRRLTGKRGGYILQVEMPIPEITNSRDNTTYGYIDRNFFAIGPDGPKFIQGFRSMMPTNSVEHRKGRIHGSADTVWVNIVPKTDA